MADPSKLYLTKRSNGIFYVGYFTDGRRRWKSTGYKFKQDALKALKDFEELFKAKIPVKSFQMFTDEFLLFASKTFSHRTYLIYRGAIGNFLRLCGNLTLTAISPQHLDQYKAIRMGEVAPVSLNIEIRTLRALMNVAVRWRLVKTNPFAQVHELALPEITPTYFTRQDFHRLLNSNMDEWLRDIIVFAVLTGMRRGEILNLKWQDVDLERKTIRIQSNGTFKTKQGRKRVIPMSEGVHCLLTGRAINKTADYVFSRRGFKINDDLVSKKLKFHLRAAGLNDSLHFHSLRHTFASWLVQDGVSLYEVQKLLGHSNISVTQVYSHLQPEKLHSTVNRISLPLN